MSAENKSRVPIHIRLVVLILVVSYFWWFTTELWVAIQLLMHGESISGTVTGISSSQSHSYELSVIDIESNRYRIWVGKNVFWGTHSIGDTVDLIWVHSHESTVRFPHFYSSVVLIVLSTLATTTIYWHKILGLITNRPTATSSPEPSNPSNPSKPN